MKFLCKLKIKRYNRSIFIYITSEMKWVDFWNSYNKAFALKTDYVIQVVDKTKYMQSGW